MRNKSITHTHTFTHMNPCLNYHASITATSTATIATSTPPVCAIACLLVADIGGVLLTPWAKHAVTFAISTGARVMKLNPAFRVASAGKPEKARVNWEAVALDSAADKEELGQLEPTKLPATTRPVLVDDRLNWINEGQQQLLL